MTTRRSDAEAPEATTTQLELPLGATPAPGRADRARRDRGARAPRAAKGPAPRAGKNGRRTQPVASARRHPADDGSRLDERTRRIGLQGIAAARALLATPEQGGPSGPAGDGGKAAGRAA